VTLREDIVWRIRASGYSRAGLQLRAWSATVDAVVTRDDVDDAADGVRTIERGALRSADDFHALDRLHVELGDE